MGCVTVSSFSWQNFVPLGIGFPSSEGVKEGKHGLSPSHRVWQLNVENIPSVCVPDYVIVLAQQLALETRRTSQSVSEFRQTETVFTRESSYCFQRVLTIAILSVYPSVRPSIRPSVTRVDQAKTVQAKITKSLPSAARKTLVSETVKLFHKFEGGQTERGR